MHFIAFGDVHESTGLIPTILDLADADRVIITGDITNRGSFEAVDRVYEAVAAVNPRILAQPGNMDTETVQAYLKDKDADLHLRVRELAPGLGLMGVGLSTPTPFGTPGEVEEKTIVRWLTETHKLAADYDHLILAVHEPPLGSRLDRLGNGQHVGSPGVRAFIERVQPDLVVTGHIHESTGIDRIGSTQVINPGMLSQGGYVRIDFDGTTVSAQLKGIG